MLKSSEQRGSRRWTRLLFTGVVLLAAMGVRELGARAVGPGAGENEAGLPLARLQTISSISDRQMTSIVIEASDPVPYLTTHPEPLTLLVDLRNVSIEGVVNRVTSPRGTIAGVTVETTESLGAPVARIRVTLAREARFRIVSNRNVIRVDVENPEAAAAASPVVMKTSIASPSSSSASSPNA
ncbi:MAG: hypothetical protein HY654_06325, partial [Acidobacteria bacterium]|nr:hypothetical protein [Acidobacteriota bacterium]